MCRPGGRVVVANRPQQPATPSCPLTSSEAHALIRDFCASVTLVQTFRNTQDSPIEAVYQFPLNDKYCICGFEADVDGKVIVGRCKEKEAAKNIYDDAISEGHGAYLLEQDVTTNMFKVNVGNLPPGKEVKIKITYVTELAFDVNQNLYWTLDSYKTQDDASSAYYQQEVLPSLILDVQLDMTSAIKSYCSPTHPIKFEFGDDSSKATVTLSGSADRSLDEVDFKLYVKLAQPHKPCARVEAAEDGDLAAMVSLYPEIPLGEDEEIYNEMIFVVDRSGSMSGARIKQVKLTMQIFLRSLCPGTMFNIVGFGSRFEFLFPEGSVEYNDKNLDIATKHVNELEANLGGTIILTPLQKILQSKTMDGYPRQLFVLTDGEVNNTTECINFVRQNAHTTRVFTFGIGADASKALVKGMADAGEGFHEFVLPGENMEVKVMRQLKRAMQPAFTNLQVEFLGDALPEQQKQQIQQAPFRLPPLFAGGRLIVYAFLPTAATAPLTIRLTAKTAIKPYEATLEINPQDAKTGTLFHQLGAQRLIRDLTEGRSFMHDDKGKLTDDRSARDVQEAMVRLSTRYGVLCQHTAFVAVEERLDATEGTMVIHRIGSKAATAAAPTTTTTTTTAVPGAHQNYYSSASSTSAQNRPVSPSLQRLNDQLAEVNSSLYANIDRIIERGERLESLVEQSETLESSSRQFSKAATNSAGGGITGWLTSSISSMFSGLAPAAPAATPAATAAPTESKEREKAERQMRLLAEEESLSQCRMGSRRRRSEQESEEMVARKREQEVQERQRTEEEARERAKDKRAALEREREREKEKEREKQKAVAEERIEEAPTAMRGIIMRQKARPATGTTCTRCSAASSADPTSKPASLHVLLLPLLLLTTTAIVRMTTSG
eukprot:TRINITY_DN1849_c0_g1_i1.p1 TRINITY_DN1849_c0_g1~~TRINITY_DN1849_c0_g1_i1.p1  ORF type:complete len:911 (+),score=210.03 TRINITY_DN1849_c0_g1_i1:64-2733(+)